MGVCDGATEPARSWYSLRYNPTVRVAEARPAIEGEDDILNNTRGHGAEVEGNTMGFFFVNSNRKDLNSSNSNHYEIHHEVDSQL